MTQFTKPPNKWPLLRKALDSKHTCKVSFLLFAKKPANKKHKYVQRGMQFTKAEQSRAVKMVTLIIFTN